MKQRTILLLFIILIILVGVVLYFVFRDGSDPQTPGTLPPPDTGTGGVVLPPAPDPSTRTDTFTIRTAQGDVVVNDFRKNSPATYGSNVVIAENPEYHIQYVQDNNQFLIALLATSTQQARQTREDAEEALLKTLGITNDACKLDVSVGVPPSYSPELAGKNYRLSFCPGSLAL